jgi:serine/threonine protein kinase
MTIDQRNLYDLFGIATDLPPDQRVRFLDEACAGRPEMRRELEALLERDARIPGFLETPAVVQFVESAGPDTVAASRGRKHPSSIGPYKILELLAEGGMAFVYLAEQDNPRRRVALKVIKPGLASEQAVQRLEHEALILARLQHPGIAQVYQAGVAEFGFGRQPFFAMELVNGLSLTRFAEREALDTTDRLELFRVLCEAVHHAHQRGVIHRDLKPDNILVDESGRPKVLDFGIARVTDADIIGAPVDTVTGQFVGTVPYMSPEQVAGDSAALDIRSDVYALGVICYELLTGALPYSVKDAILPDALHAIRTAEPLPPSTVKRALRRDLDKILLKALEKDRDRRYQSVHEFSADVTRFLNHEPVEAQPPSAFYQLQKFARRHRPLAAVFSIAALAILSGLGASLWQGARARAEARRAQLAEVVANQQFQFLSQMLLQANPQEAAIRPTSGDARKPGDVPIREVLDSAVIALDENPPQRAQVEASLRQLIGYTYLSLWELEAAEHQLLRARELLAAVPDADAKGRCENLRSLGDTYIRMNRHDDADSIFEQALHECAELLGPTHADFLRIQLTAGWLFAQSSRPEEAEATWLDLLSKLEPSSQKAMSVQLECQARLGDLYRTQKRFDEAIPLLESVLSKRQDRFGDHHVNTLTAMNNLALAYTNAGREQEAVVLYRRALPGHRELWGPDHRETLICQLNLRRALVELKEYDEVERLSLDAIPRVQRTFRPDEIFTVDPINSLAFIYAEQGRFDEALAYYERVVAHAFVQMHPALHARMLSNKGRCLMELGRFSEAESDLRAAEAELIKHHPPDHTNVTQVRTRLADLFERQGRDTEAAKWRRVLEGNTRPAPEPEDP